MGIGERSGMTKIDERFQYHAPTEKQLEILKVNRQMCADLAFLIESTPMEPRCKALAITKLEEVSMWSNKGIVFCDE